ncbi:hypothetical protein V7O66_13780 [Methanolobus sp. ZRKC3]|uniref:hypothetical protein n=1 Tax=Methanolobus sp. ZRKC3 TaxID=3125786 RepID=UPI00324DDCDC
MSVGECCGGCGFYKPMLVTEGFCRYSAPVAGHGFPIVPHDNWCGQFKEKEHART